LQETKGQYAVTLLGQKEIVQVELVRRAFSEHYYRQLLSKVGTKDKSLPKRRAEELGALPNLLSGHVRLFQGLLSDPTEQEKNIETKRREKRRKTGENSCQNFRFFIERESVQKMWDS
jgi:hypothetical protein